MAYDLYIHAGGYWSYNGMYLGGEIHKSENHIDWELTRNRLSMLVVAEGYSENMNTFSYFESGIEGSGKKNLIDDADFVEWNNSLVGQVVRHIYVVRNDDPDLQGFRRDNATVDGESDGGDGIIDSESDRENDSSSDSSSDEDLKGKGVMYDSDNDEHVGDCSSFHIGQIFEDKESIKWAINQYAVREKVNIGFIKSEEKKVSAMCAEDDCKWHLYASINSGSNGRFVVRTLNDEHKCSWSGKVKLYTARKIAGDIVNEFRYNPMAGRVIKSKLEADRINVSKNKCQRAREICGSIIREQYVEQFSRMYDYVLELRESNPGSTIILGTQAQVFEKFYACFYAQKHGWKKACRQIIHLDGTHLKGRMKGQLLSAIGRDANDEMYPIAWAIVDVENTINWEWFLENLRDDLELGMGNGVALVSDQQKGLVAAIDLVCPYVEHRMCAWHVLGNFRKRYGESPFIKKAFWRLSHAYNTREFERAMEYMKSIDVKAHEAIHKYARHWARYGCLSIF